MLHPRPVLPPNALLFDMDGTMVDSEPLWFDLQREFVRDRGHTWTPADAHRCVGGGLVNALRYMEQAFGFAVDVERDRAWMVDAFVDRLPRVTTKQGLLELLDAVRAQGLRCAVASSSTRRLVEATLERIGVRDRFDAVVTGECVVRAKPAPDIFLEAASRLGVSVFDCVVIEDALAGVEAARAAGMRVVAVPERDRAAFEGLADAVVDDLHGARALLLPQR